MIMKATYSDRKKYEKYDDKHFIVYLNEEVIPDYVPEVMGRAGSAGTLHGLFL